MYPCTKYGDENPLTIHEIYAALTLSDTRSDWAFESAATLDGAAAKQAENYNIMLKCAFLFIQCQCFDKRKVVFLLEKVSVIFLIRVLLGPIIRVFF